MAGQRDSGSAKPKKAEIFRTCADFITQKDTEAGRFPSKFHLYEPEPGKKQILEEYKPKTLRFVGIRYVANMLIQYIAKHYAGSRLLALTVKEATEAVEYWVSETDPLPARPRLMAEKSYPDYALHRLPFDFRRIPGPTPTFDEFMSRCSNSQALMAWIGSLLYDQASRQQYVWLHGEGGDGKGSLARFLQAILGPGYGSTMAQSSNSNFWTYSLYGKRLVVFPDCNDFSFPNKGLFKSLTGGDAIPFEPKNQPIFTDTPTAMFMFISNEHAGITGQKSNMRRIICCDVEPIKGPPLPQHVIDSRMLEEGASFIGKCLNLYEELCPDFGNIPVDNSLTEELVSQNEEQWEALFCRYFKAVPGKSVSSRRVNEIYTIEKLSSLERKNFLSYMRRNHGIKNSKRNGVRYYDNMAQLTAAEEIEYVNNKNKNHTMEGMENIAHFPIKSTNDEDEQ